MTTMNVLSIKLITVPGATQMTANDINDNRQVVGQFTDAKGIPHGFVYEDESVCQLDYPDSTGSNILGINSLAQMVGMFTTPTGTFGFFYDRGTFDPPLTYPGAGNLTIANRVTDRGQIAGDVRYASGRGSFVAKLPF
jgi:probable HAF family extracellular repeat protein